MCVRMRTSVCLTNPMRATCTAGTCHAPRVHCTSAPSALVVHCCILLLWSMLRLCGLRNSWSLGIVCAFTFYTVRAQCNGEYVQSEVFPHVVHDWCTVSTHYVRQQCIGVQNRLSWLQCFGPAIHCWRKKLQLWHIFLLKTCGLLQFFGTALSRCDHSLHM